MMSVFIYVILTLIILIVAWGLYIRDELKHVIETSYSNTPLSNKTITRDNPKYIVYNMNKVWNRNPDDYKHLVNGHEKCMVYLHSFDCTNSQDTGASWNGYCEKYSNLPWCPTIQTDLKEHVPFLPSIYIPNQGVSFSAFNKHLIRKGVTQNNPNGSIFNNINAHGFIFFYGDDYVKNKTISPMCFYPTDSSSIMRGMCGCGEIGIQRESDCAPNEDGYDLSSNEINEFTNQAIRYERNNFIVESSLILQKSLNFNNFVEMCKSSVNIESELSLNEIIFKNWIGIDFHDVPIVAFFYLEEHDKRKEIVSVANTYYKLTGDIIPIVSFNLTPSDGIPFKLDKWDPNVNNFD